MSVVFVPFFFFASVYSQVALGKSSSNAGVYILYFFIGFVVRPRSAGGCSTAAGHGRRS